MSEGIESYKRVEIDGVGYIIYHPSPTKAWKLSIRLAKIIGEPFASMASAGASDKAPQDVLSTAIGLLTDNLDEEKSLEVVKDVMASIALDQGNKPMLSGATFEGHFQGRMGSLFKLLVEAIRFQFQDFSDAIGDAIASVVGTQAKGAA